MVNKFKIGTVVFLYSEKDNMYLSNDPHLIIRVNEENGRYTYDTTSTSTIYSCRQVEASDLIVATAKKVPATYKRMIVGRYDEQLESKNIPFDKTNFKVMNGLDLLEASYSKWLSYLADDNNQSLFNYLYISNQKINYSFIDFFNDLTAFFSLDQIELNHTYAVSAKYERFYSITSLLELELSISEELGYIYSQCDTNTDLKLEVEMKMLVANH